MDGQLLLHKKPNAKLDKKLLQETGMVEADFIRVSSCVDNIWIEPASEMVLTHFSTYGWSSLHFQVLYPHSQQNIQSKNASALTWQTSVFVIIPYTKEQSIYIILGITSNLEMM